MEVPDRRGLIHFNASSTRLAARTNFMGENEAGSLMRLLFACSLFATAAVTNAANLPEWPQFGGPHRNFTTDSVGLADSWPSTGPKKLWERPLGEGYSGIAVDNGILYTMY